MRVWVFVFLASMTTGVIAQSSLPPCPSVGEIMNCSGDYISNTGEIYTGEYRDGKFIGRSKKGASIDAQVRRGRLNGRGTLVNASGSRYDGEFVDGRRHGQGVFTWPDGASYTGMWRADKAHGNGTLKYPDGKEYVGDWVDNRQTGKGKLILPDGSEYVGDWVDGQLTGKGTYTFPDGAKYVGEFNKGGKFHGEGTLYFANGRVEKTGQWKDNEFVVARDPFNPDPQLLAAFESSMAEYLKRKKTILEQVMNYSTTSFEDGSAEIFWVQGKGNDKCLLNPVIAPQGSAMTLARLVSGVPNLLYQKPVDIRNFNQLGFRIKTEGGVRVFGDEQFSFIGPSSTVIERLQRAWGLAFKECPSNQKRAF
jgi:hypothetical protein